MKIACQSCQAKYTIADEKVLGRVVKIRCKKCSATIVINGNEVTEGTAGMAANEDPTAVAPASQAGGYDYAAQQGEEWTVNVADGDQRTMRIGEIVAQFKAGVVNDETYCWKDGMNDWLPVREIPELASQCAGAPQLSSPSAASAYASPAAPEPMAAGGGSLGALFGGGGGTPFPAAAASAGSDANGGAAFGAIAGTGPAARRAGGRGVQGGDLFGNVADAGGENDVMTSAPQGVPQAHEAGDGKLTGQRNENSVLFSLSALTQNSPSPSVPAPQGDGSGLIDIRALASTMSPNQGKQNNHIDDIMNLGGGGAFSAALAAPVLSPATMDASDGAGGYPAPSSSNKLMVIAFASLAGVLILVIAVLLMRKPSPATADTTSPTASAGSGTAAGQAAPGADTASAAAVAATAPAAATNTAAPPTTAAAANDTTGPSTALRHRGGGGGTAAAAGGGGAAVAAVPAPAPPPASFDQAIAKAAGNSGGGGGGGGAAAAESTAQFDRGAAGGALGTIAGNVQSCKRNDGPTGAGHVQVTFSPSGSVQSAVTDTPPYAGTAVGGCVAGKFRGAHVPAFGGGTVKVGKSFVIN